MTAIQSYTRSTSRRATPEYMHPGVLESAQLTRLFPWLFGECVPSKWNIELRLWVYKAVEVVLPESVDYVLYLEDMAHYDSHLLDDETAGEQLRAFLEAVETSARDRYQEPGPRIPSMQVMPSYAPIRYAPVRSNLIWGMPPWLFWGCVLIVIVACVTFFDGPLYRRTGFSTLHRIALMVQSLQGRGLGNDPVRIWFNERDEYTWLAADYCQPAWFAVDDKGAVLAPPDAWNEADRDQLLESRLAGCVPYYNTGFWNTAGQWGETTWQALQYNRKSRALVRINTDKQVDPNITLVWLKADWWNMQYDPDLRDLSMSLGSNIYETVGIQPPVDPLPTISPTPVPVPTSAVPVGQGPSEPSGQYQPPAVPTALPEAPQQPAQVPTATLTGGVLPTFTPLPADWIGPTPTMTNREALAYLIATQLAKSEATATAQAAKGTP